MGDLKHGGTSASPGVKPWTQIRAGGKDSFLEVRLLQQAPGGAGLEPSRPPGASSLRPGWARIRKTGFLPSAP